MTDYHCPESCNKCKKGNNNFITEIWDEHHNLCEASTKCNICGFEDYWAYGFFQSGKGVCETYNNNIDIKQLENNNEC